VLPSQDILALLEAGIINAGEYSVPPENIQPASLDLRLGPRAYRIRCSFLPDRELVDDRMKDLVIDELDLRDDGAVLETNRPYLVPLKERLALPAPIRGRANPKSSTGRVDVFTRLITDRGHGFDEVAAGYEGPLYLEVVPLSFPVRAREDLSLNQLRLSIGRTVLSDGEIAELQTTEPLLYRDEAPVPLERLLISDGLFLSLDLSGDESGRVGYQARDTPPLLDLSSERALEPDRYFEPVLREPRGGVVLNPKRFYLLMSNEAVSIHPTLAAEMTAYDPTSGELRTHYAGFFDPGFGFDPSGRFRGSTAALEVRAHDVPFMIENGQRVCKLTFERMRSVPNILYGRGIGSSYQRQQETLSRHFARGVNQ
jgi:dCTP deaminase